MYRQRASGYVALVFVLKLRGILLALLLSGLALAAAPPISSAAVLVDHMDFPDEGSVGSTNEMAPNDNRDTEAADDFIVDAASKGWSIEKVEVMGAAGPPLTSVGVSFYADAAGVPSATALVTRTIVPSSAQGDGNFVIPVDPPVKLDPGTYWLSVVANAAVVTTDFWAWQKRTLQFNNIWAFRNPGGFYTDNCKTWTSATVCFPGDAPDLMFRLSGTTVVPPPPPPVGTTGPGGTTTPPGGGSTLTPTLVDKSAPIQTAQIAKAASLKKGSLSLVVTETENSTVRITGTVSVPKLSKVYRVGPVSKQVLAGQPTKIALKFNSKALRAIRRALAAHKKLSAKLTVTGSDAAKNTAVTRKTIRLKP